MVLDFPSVVRQFWGRAAGRPAIRRGTLVFWGEKRAANKWAALIVRSDLASAGRGPGHDRRPYLSAPDGGPCHRGGDLYLHCELERCGDHRGHDRFSGGRQRRGHS